MKYHLYLSPGGSTTMDKDIPVGTVMNSFIFSMCSYFLRYLSKSFNPFWHTDTFIFDSSSFHAVCFIAMMNIHNSPFSFGDNNKDGRNIYWNNNNSWPRGPFLSILFVHLNSKWGHLLTGNMQWKQWCPGATKLIKSEPMIISVRTNEGNGKWEQHFLN